MTAAHHAIAYVELTVDNMAEAAAFYTAAFGWSFNDYGEDYSGICRPGGDGEMGGLARGARPTPGGPLVLLESEDVDASARAVTAAGGTIDGEIDDYPGGRRFIFVDPAGNRLGVFQASA